VSSLLMRPILMAWPFSQSTTPARWANLRSKMRERVRRGARSSCIAVPTSSSLDTPLLMVCLCPHSTLLATLKQGRSCALTPVPGRPSELCSMAITPDDGLVFATMTGYGSVTSWHLKGNILSIAKDPACKRPAGDGTLRGVGGIVGASPSDYVDVSGRCIPLSGVSQRLKTYRLRNSARWLA
jgi:hypothetical protein